jgi:hypothetical protein
MIAQALAAQALPVTSWIAAIAVLQVLVFIAFHSLFRLLVWKVANTLATNAVETDTEEYYNGILLQRQVRSGGFAARSLLHLPNDFW